jgi:hypothetical protein
MDGHQSHKSLKVIEFARQNFVTLVTIPPHTSHRLQPLDLTFFGPLKKAIWHEMDKWMTSNPGKRITDYDLCSLFTPAYMRVASVEKAVNGFSSAGIWPYNPDKFSDDDFAPSTVTEIPAPTTTDHSQQLVPLTSTVTGQMDDRERAVASNPIQKGKAVCIKATNRPKFPVGLSSVADNKKQTPAKNLTNETNLACSKHYDRPTPRHRVSLSQISPLPQISNTLGVGGVGTI